MDKKSIFLGILLVVAAFCFWSFYPQENDQSDFSDRTKITLRQVGNQLLLANKDSTSLILPIVKVDEQKYEITFEKELGFEPNILVEIVKENIEKSSLSKNYRVAVLQCLDDEVAYSFEINAAKEKTIIPCAGRLLPKKCYKIQVNFLNKKSPNKNNLGYILIPIVLIIIYWRSYTKKKRVYEDLVSNKKEKTLGSFTFYPEQNKLVKKKKEIALSKKECDLLEIFIANINLVVKREELTKRVWEDNGVIVGRSLDTYISKLRKKLQEDKSIKLINIHGVGYKLEIAT